MANIREMERTLWCVSFVIEYVSCNLAAGSLVSLNILGQRILIVNSAQVAVDLLEKRGSIYSDRPTSPMGGELVGWKNTLVFLKYGPRFRAGRRMAHQLFGNHATMKKFHPVEELETRRFLKRLLVKPMELNAHIRRYVRVFPLPLSSDIVSIVLSRTAGAIILRISHGYEVQEENDVLIALAEKATKQFSLSSAPGGFWVNHIPARELACGSPLFAELYIFSSAPYPQVGSGSWIPANGEGMGENPRKYGRYALRFRKATNGDCSRCCIATLTDCCYLKAAGKAPLSFTSSQLEGRHLSTEEEFNVKWLAASLYSGGADTVGFVFICSCSLR